MVVAKFCQGVEDVNRRLGGSRVVAVSGLWSKEDAVGLEFRVGFVEE